MSKAAAVPTPVRKAATPAELDLLIATAAHAKATADEAYIERKKAETALLEAAGLDLTYAGTQHITGATKAAVVVVQADYKLATKDLPKFAAACPDEQRTQILKPSVDYSRSGYNAAIQALEALVVIDPEKRLELERLKKAHALYVKLGVRSVTVKIDNA